MPFDAVSLRLAPRQIRAYADHVLDDFVRRLSEFGDLSEADRIAASSLPTVIERVPRAHAVPCTRNGAVVRILRAGWAYRSTTLRNGARQITALLLPGEICSPTGFSAVSERQEICAATDVELTCVPAELIRTFLDRPNVADALRISDVVDAAILQEWVVNLTRRPAIPRTAHLMLELETRLAVRGTTIAGEFELPLTQAVLGDALGLSSVHLNRTVRRLREEELLVFRAGRIAILDRPRLVRIAEYDSRYLTPITPNKRHDAYFR